MGKESLFFRVDKTWFTHVFNNLDRFGSKWSAEHICSSIELMDPEFKLFLAEIDRCGAIDILTAICIIVYTQCDEITNEWLDRDLFSCEWGQCAIELAQKRVSEIVKKYNLDTPIDGEDFLIMNGSIANFERYVWENTQEKYACRIKRTDYSNIGFWYPGLFQNHINEFYFKKLDNYALQFLCFAGKENQLTIEERKTEQALVRKRISGYISELGAYYFSCLLNSANIVLTSDPLPVAKMDYLQFSRFLQEIVSHRMSKTLYVSSSIVELYESMLSQMEYYGDKIPVISIKNYLPLLYQMIGKDQEAYDKLFDLIDSQRANDNISRFREEHLLAAYRCLLTTQDEKKRNRLISVFDELYFGNSGIRAFISLADNIVKFYERYTERVRNTHFWFESRPDLRDLHRDQLYIINHWIRSGLLLSVLSKLLEDSKFLTHNSSAIMSNGRDCLESFVNLFSGITSHSNTEIRFYIPDVQCILEPTAPKFSNPEIFDLYTWDEQKHIQLFDEQLTKTIRSIPHITMIWRYKALKNQVAKYWKTDPESILCSKLSSALRGIQSNYFTKGKSENELNNELAIYLRATYGESNVHREEPQGTSSSSKSQGEADVLVYIDGYQFALIESLRLSSVDVAKLDDHLERLLKKYNTQGVEQTVLIIYAENVQESQFFEKVEKYLTEYQYPYPLLSTIKREPAKTANLCHHSASYSVEGYSRSFHVFTVILQPK